MAVIKTLAFSDHTALILNELAKHYNKNESEVIENLIREHVVHDLDKDVAQKIIDTVKTK